MSDLKDLLDQFRKGPDVVASVVLKAAGADFDYKPAPGKWSARQILAHLSDAEIEAAVRFRRIIAEENPNIYSYDQNAWADNLDYSTREPRRSLETFRLLRNENYQLLSSLEPAKFQRTAVHSERGSMTLRQWLEIYARHAEKHAAQISRALDASSSEANKQGAR